jgi:ribosomal protein S18 acetylase RimI-like enzyme
MVGNININKNIVIQKAELDNLNDILVLLHQLSRSNLNDNNCFPDYTKTFNQILDNPDYYLYVASIDGKIVATGTLLIQINLTHNCKPYGHIENVVTDTNYRGRGIGDVLIHQLISKAQQRGCYKVILNCVSKNIHFYNKCGFNQTGEVEMRITF